MSRNKLQSNTCLAVLQDHEGYLYFASDRRMSWGMGKAQIKPQPKSRFRNGVLLMGTGHCWTLGEIRDHVKFRQFTKNDNPEIFMHDVLVPAVIKHFKAQGFLRDKERRLFSNSDEFTGAIILVGLGSHLYELEVTNDNIIYDEITAPYGHGCGGTLALGSLLTTNFLDKELTIEARLTLALQVAAQISPGCDDNIDIISNKPKYKSVAFGQQNIREV